MMKLQTIKLSLVISAISSLTACFDGNFAMQINPEDGVNNNPETVVQAEPSTGLQQIILYKYDELGEVYETIENNYDEQGKQISSYYDYGADYYYFVDSED